MVQDSRIKWKKGDYITLGKAISEFNKKINKLNLEERKLYLPENINYKDVKQKITTRKELNRVINSLKRFQKKGAEDLYITKAGEEITKWERKELGIQSRIARNRLKRELTSLYIPNEQGYSRASMGSERKREIEANLKKLKQIENKKGYEFDKLRKSLNLQGSSDYTMKKAIIFQENFMKELENLSNSSLEFKIIYEEFKKISNPIEFFNTTQKSNALQDFFEWYITPENYASFGSKIELGQYILNQYELVPESIIIEEL